MNWLSLLTSVLALVFVLGLIGVVSYLLRKYGHFNNLAVKKGGKRLRVEESLIIDARRRLIIIRRDDVEHLVMIGPESETVIESGIKAKGKNSEK